MTMTTTYLPTREKTKAIKTRLRRSFKAADISVLKGTGTASHWITTTVYISRPETCRCTPEQMTRWPNCPECREATRATNRLVLEESHEALRELGASFGTYYSDDYSDSTPHDSYLINVYIR